MMIAPSTNISLHGVFDLQETLNCVLEGNAKTKLTHDQIITVTLLSLYTELGELISAELYSDFLEEAVDVLHFITYITILCDFSAEDILSHPEINAYFRGSRPHSDIPSKFEPVLKAASDLTNCLERYWKYWKRQPRQMYTKTALHAVWLSYVNYIADKGVNVDELFKAYQEKNKINHQRQADRY